MLSLRRISTLCAVTSLLTVPFYAGEPLDANYPLSKMFTSVGKKNFPGVVFVRVDELEEDDLSYTNSSSLFPQVRRGSGFFVSSDGYIMTSAHIVAGASKITISFDRGKELE